LIGTKTGRKVITMTAPRLAEKRLIHVSEMNAMRAYGAQFAAEQMKTRAARELFDMRGKFDRTLEFWAASTLKGKIYDSDGSTILVDYNMAGDHTITLTSTDVWTDKTNSNPVNRIRAWKQKIEDDCMVPITSWQAYCGSGCMDALVAHTEVIKLLQYQQGKQIAEEGRIVNLAGVHIEEYNGSYINNSDTRTRFIAAADFILIGIAADTFDCPYAPIVDNQVPGGVGNVVNGKPALFFSKSWEVEDPSGRWIKVEGRPLPVLQRPEAIIRATVY
jgi:hypothetical protein